MSRSPYARSGKRTGGTNLWTAEEGAIVEAALDALMTALPGRTPRAIAARLDVASRNQPFADEDWS